MSVYYKFKSAKDFDSIPIEGQFVSVASLKERIFETKQLGRGTDFDLVVSNAQTDEEYADEAAMIPKNTSVLIRRVPGRRRLPIIAEQVEPKGVEDKVGELPQQPNSTLVGESSTMKYPEESEWDVFGNDLYATPEAIPAILSNTTVDVAAVSNVDEDNKIKELIDSSALDWNRPMQDAYGTGRGFGRGMGGRMMGGRGRGFGFGRGGGLQGNTPPPGYICHRCKVPGHFIQHCPTNGDPNFDIRRVKPPTGIPRSMLMATPDGSYALPSGAVAVLKPNEAAFEKEIEGFPTTRPVSDLPQELRCPLCKDAMKDAVLTSKCCFRTFCYKCIRDYIVTKSMCVCGVSNVLADDLVPNYTLRETISRLLDSTTSSTENGGSFVQVQDMESARQGQPKVPSPTISATSKDEARQPPSKEYSLDTKEVERTSGGNLANTLTISLEKKAGQNADPSEATPESVSAKEAISLEGAPVPEGGQEKLLAGDQGKKKKKKKTRVPVTGAAADMQWGAYQDFGAENFSGMPLGPSAFNPYWPGGMPMGMDGYMAPFGGGMPYMGYPPGPFDVPYGGMLSQDPFAQQGYNMMHPGIPQRDLSELGTGNMGINQGRPVMSREEFEARKADVRRKREMERLSERDHSRDRGDRGREVDRGREADRGDRGREVGSSLDVSPMKAKPRLMSQATPVDRTDRSDRAEKDRLAPSRHLSPRPKKRRASDQDDTTLAMTAAATADKKQKGSVFSRISFPEAGSKKSKTELSNGLKDKQKERETSVAGHRPAANGHRDESKAGKGTPASSEGRRGRGHDHESSEEEYHFKRRPISRRDTEDEGRGKKERGEHGHSHDRPKRR